MTADRFRVRWQPDETNLYHSSKVKLSGISRTGSSVIANPLKSQLLLAESSLNINRRRAPLVPSAIDISDITGFQTEDNLIIEKTARNQMEERDSSITYVPQEQQIRRHYCAQDAEVIIDSIRTEINIYLNQKLSTEPTGSSFNRPNFLRIREAMVKALNGGKSRCLCWVYDLLWLAGLPFLKYRNDVLVLMDALNTVFLLNSYVKQFPTAQFAILQWALRISRLTFNEVPSSVHVELHDLAKNSLQNIFIDTKQFDEERQRLYRSCIYSIVENCAMATLSNTGDVGPLLQILQELNPNEFIDALVRCMCTTNHSIISWLIGELGSNRINWVLSAQSQLSICSITKNVFDYLRRAQKPEIALSEVGMLLKQKFSDLKPLCGTAIYNVAATVLSALSRSFELSKDVPSAKAMIIGYCVDALNDSSFATEFVSALLTLIAQGELTDIVHIFYSVLEEFNATAGDILRQTFLPLMKRVSLHPVFSLHNDLRRKIRSMLMSICSTHEKSFYMPLIKMLKSDSISQTHELLRVVVFSMDIMGDYQFWFGIPPDDRYGTSAELFDPETRRKLDGNFLSSAASIASVKIKCDLRYIDLLVLIILGKDILHNTHEKAHRIIFTVGHVAILMEFVWMIRRLRKETKTDAHSVELQESLKLALHQVEDKVSDILVERNRQGVKLDDAAKTVLTSVLLEIRLFADYSSRPEWMNLVLEWISTDIPRLTTTMRPESIEESSISYQLGRKDEGRICIEPLFERLRQLYEIGCRDYELLSEAKTPIQRNFNMFSERLRLAFGDHTKGLYYVKESSILVRGLPYALLSVILPVYPCLNDHEVSKLLPFIWQNIPKFDRLLSRRAGFVLLYGADRAPKLAKSLIVQDLYSKSPNVRISALLKFSSLFYKRQYAYYQHLPSEAPLLRSSVESIPSINPYHQGSDFQAYPGAFKAPVQNLPFVPPDFGTDASNPANLPGWLAHLKNFSRLENSELKADKDEAMARERNRRIQTPLMALPGGALLETDFSSMDSKIFTKAKIVFPVALNLISYAMIDLLNDDHAGVHNTCREIISNVLRDDPVLLLRPYFNDLPTLSFPQQKESLTRFRRILLSRRTFPTAFTYLLFNYLLGFLTWASISSRAKGNRNKLASLILPLLSDLVSRVQGLSLKDFKKGRVEHLIITFSGFWFKHGQNSMFPRQDRSEANFCHRLKVSETFLGVLIFRISQCQLLIQFMLRNTSDVDSIRKELAAELKQVREGKAHISSVIPENPDSSECHDKAHTNCDLILMITLYCKALLNQLDVMFTLTGRSYEDIEELKLFLDEVNYLILRFAYDHIIVRQSVALYINVSSRFRRLFFREGYQLFLPTLFSLAKIAKQNNDSEIYQGIMFAFHYFYSIHEEAFILQLFACLDRPIIFDQTMPYGLLFDIFRTLEQNNARDKFGVHTMVPDLTTEENTRTFPLEDTFRLLASIVAFNPFSARSNQSLVILQSLITQIINCKDNGDFIERLSPLLNTIINSLLSRFTKSESLWSSFKEKIANNRSSVAVRSWRIETGAAGKDFDFSAEKSDSSKILLKISNRIEFLRLVVLKLKLQKILSENSAENDLQSYQEAHFMMLIDIMKAISKESLLVGISMDWSFLIDFTKEVVIPISNSYFGLSAIYVYANMISNFLRSQSRSQIHYMLDSICEFLEKPLLAVMKQQYVVSLIYQKFFLEILPLYSSPQKRSIPTKDLPELDSSFVRLITTLCVFYQDIWQDITQLIPVPSLRFVARILIPFCLHISSAALMRGKHVLNYRNGDRTVARIILNVLSYLLRSINNVILELPKRTPHRSCSPTTINEGAPLTYESGSRKSSFMAADSQPRRRGSSVQSTGSSNISVPWELTEADQQLSLLLIAILISCRAGSKYRIGKERPGIWHELANFIRQTFSEEPILCVNQETICLFVEIILQEKSPLSQPLMPFIHELIQRSGRKNRTEADYGSRPLFQSETAAARNKTQSKPNLGSSGRVVHSINLSSFKADNAAMADYFAHQHLSNSTQTFDFALWGDRALALMMDKTAFEVCDDKIIDSLSAHIQKLGGTLGK